MTNRKGPGLYRIGQRVLADDPYPLLNGSRCSPRQVVYGVARLRDFQNPMECRIELATPTQAFDFIKVT
jgi:hypothetical protein